MKYVAPLRYDVIFKKAFSVPEIFSAFVSDVIGQPVSVHRVETEKKFSVPIGPVGSRFDLYAEDLVHRMIVDIQHQRFSDHYDRFLFYHCVAIIEQVTSAKNYRPTLQVITIVVLTSGDWHKTDIAIIDFDPKDRYGRSLNEIKHQVIYLCPKYVQDDTPAAVREWMRAIEDTLDEEVDETTYSPTIQRVFDLIEKSRITPEEHVRMKEEYSQQEKLREERAAREQAEREAEQARQAAQEAQKREAEAQKREAEAQRVAEEARKREAEAQRVAEEARKREAEAQKREAEAQREIAQLLARLQALEDEKKGRSV